MEWQLVLSDFTVYCAHRSGSNFLQSLITENFHKCRAVELSRTDVGWKHSMYHNTYMSGKQFCIVMARHPIKWVNSCLRFNADMWKWWNVNGKEPGGLSFEYNKTNVSIPKMITKWNNFYNEWLNNADCDFVWYADLLNSDTRESILLDIANKNKLTRMNHTSWHIPNKVQHSDSYTEEKRLSESNLTTNNMLDDKPHIIDYINHNVDKNLLNRMMELSYENRGHL